jgi:uncharacterized protein YjbI with pentapeptide repeats
LCVMRHNSGVIVRNAIKAGAIIALLIVAALLIRGGFQLWGVVGWVGVVSALAALALVLYLRALWYFLTSNQRYLQYLQHRYLWRLRRTSEKWVPRTGYIVAVFVALALLISLYGGYRYGWRWTGIVAGGDFPKRTLWDWLKLLIIPAVLAIGGYWFRRAENRATQVAAEERAKGEALQSYLDQIGRLLLDENTQLRLSKEGAEVRSLARAWTLTVLPRLDGHRMGSVVQFLYESGLITKDHVVIDLTGAFLDRAYLFKANLIGANLRGTSLSRANLVEAMLSEADLGEAELYGANLNAAKLIGTNLSKAVLMGDPHGIPVPRTSASPKSTYIWGGDDPKNADLEYANLTRANLTDAYVSKEQLRSAYSLEGATMPDGQVLKSSDNPDGPTFKEWLKRVAQKEERRKRLAPW